MKRITTILLTLYCALNLFSQTVSTIVDDPTTKFRDALIFDAAGNLYCADYGGTSIYKRTPNGTVTTFATGFNTPNGMAFNSNGDMFMCDNQASLIYKLDNTGNVLASYPTPFPSGIIKDIASDTMIFTVYSAQHELKKLAPDGTIYPFHAGSPLVGPVGLAYIGNDLFVGNFTNREIYRVEQNALTYIATVPGPTNGTLGFIANVGDKLYGTSWQASKIYEIVTTEIDSTILYAGSANSSLDGPLSTATFSQPNGIIGNATGDTMYISQYGTGKLRMITELSLGLEDNNSVVKIASVSPNPTSKTVLIHLASLENTSVEIFNSTGNLIQQTKNHFGEEIAIDLIGEAGLYFIKVIQKEQSAIFKVLKAD